MSSPLPSNLRYLVESLGSIAEFCRAVAINRQQFNKYLNGGSLPSPRNLRRICDYTGMSESDLFLPYVEFVELYRKPRGKTGASQLFSFIETAQRASTDLMKKYEGLYFKYYYSLSKPGLIRKSLLSISISERGAVTKCVEPAGKDLSRLGIASLCKYTGEALFVGDRLFLVEYEYLSNKEISSSIFFPTYMSKAVVLHGIMLGVSAGSRHEPAATRVLLARLGSEYTLKKAMRSCGLFRSGSEEIDDNIRKIIDNGGSDDDMLFRARTSDDINSI